MTTIAYKDGIIAYDSRLSGGDNFILSDEFEKKVVVDKITYFFSGAVSDQKEFIDLYQRNDHSKRENCPNITALIYRDSLLYLSGFAEDRLYVMPVTYACEAIGSGWQFARAAMIMGASASEAVKTAMKLDMCTGGYVTEFVLGKS